MAACNIRQRAAGSAVSFETPLHGGQAAGYQENQYSRECLLVVIKRATGLYMDLGVQVTQGAADGHIRARALKLRSQQLSHYVYQLLNKI